MIGSGSPGVAGRALRGVAGSALDLAKYQKAAPLQNGPGLVCRTKTNYHCETPMHPPGYI